MMKNAENKILLPNRYGDKNYLVRESEHTYCIEFDKDTDPHMGVIGGLEKIEVIDPSGGPFISVGDEVEGKKITHIYFADKKWKLVVE